MSFLASYSAATVAIRTFGGNNVFIPQNLSVHLDLSQIIFGAISSTPTCDPKSACFTFPATITEDQRINFRVTDVVLQWPISAGNSPYLLYGQSMSKASAVTTWVVSPARGEFNGTGPLNIGVAFPAPVSSMGSSYSFHQGLLSSSQFFGNSINFAPYIQNIFAEPNITQALDEMISVNALDVLLVPATGLFSVVKTMALRYPKLFVVVFCDAEDVFNSEGTYTPDLPANFRYGFVRQDVGRYLAGIAAGYMAVKLNQTTVGYVMGFSDSQYIMGANSFLMGMQRVSQNLKLATLTTNSFYDEYAEQQAAKQFISQGIKIISHQTESMQPVAVAVSSGGYGIGSNYDSQSVLGPKVLTSAMLFWYSILQDVLQDGLDHKWDEGHEFKGFTDGACGVSTISGYVPYDGRQLIASESVRLMNVSGEPLFCGPITDNKGNLAIATGQCLDYNKLYSSEFFISGVIDGGNFVPPPPYQEMHYIGAPLRYIIWAITALCMLVLGVMIVGVVLNRYHMIMKSASWKFCVMMIGSCMCALAGNFLFGLDDQIVANNPALLDRACQALPWIVSLPSTISIACLFAKIWRVKQIFTTNVAKTNTREFARSLTDERLFGTIGMCALPDFILLVIWTTTQPLAFIRNILSTDAYGNPIESFGVCMQKDQKISFFVFAAVLYKAMMLVYGSILAYQTQSVPSALNESKHISYSIIIAFEVLVIIFPLNYIMTTSPLGLFIFRAGSNLLINGATPLIIMAPKFYALYSGSYSISDFSSNGSDPKNRPTENPRLMRATSNNALGESANLSNIASRMAKQQNSSQQNSAQQNSIMFSKPKQGS